MQENQNAWKESSSNREKLPSREFFGNWIIWSCVICFLNARNTFFDLTGKNDSIYESRRRAEEVRDNRNRLSDDDNRDDNYNEVSDNNDDDDDYDEYDDDYEGPTTKTESFLKSEKIAMFMAKQNRATLSSVGHQFEDMVLSCTYRGMPCGRVVK